MVKSTKYLGVTIQDDGKFDVHVNNTINAGNKMLGFVRRNLRVNSRSGSGFISSKVLYGYSATGRCVKTSVKEHS